tara:strand:- start:121 stop:846 length:726 start_codon:yes stop_codon:yes gene_type:complete
MATDVNKTTLKTYFNTGDQPTEAQFTDFIDSTINQTDGTDQSISSSLDMHGTSVSASGGIFYVSGSIHCEDPAATGRGAGAATGSAFSVRTTNLNGETITTILVDLEGMKSKNDDNDIIGIAGTDSASLMRWETARHGVCYKIEMACIEAPTGGTEDIDLLSNSSPSATYDTDGSGFTALLTAGGDWSLGKRLGTDGSNGVQTQLANNDYLYLAAGDANTDGVYTAGKYIIKLYGVKTDFS